MGRLLSELSRTRETSAMPRGWRDAEPAKITSSGLRARTALADCSPRTHRTASETLDLPEPLGPTMTTMPGARSVVVCEAKDLKPTRSRRRRYKVAKSLTRSRHAVGRRRQDGSHFVRSHGHWRHSAPRGTPLREGPPP